MNTGLPAPALSADVSATFQVVACKSGDWCVARYRSEFDLTNPRDISRAVGVTVDDLVLPRVAVIEGRAPSEAECRQFGSMKIEDEIGSLRLWTFLWRDKPVARMRARESGLKYALEVEIL